MLITMYSFFTAVFLSSVWIFVIYLIRKKQFFIRYLDIYSVSLIYLLFFGRITIPLEFSFTKVVNVEFILNPIVTGLSTEIVTLGTQDIEIFDFLIAIWLLGIFIQLAVFIKQYWAFHKKLSVLPTQEMRQLNEIMRSIQGEKRRHISIQVMCCPHVSSPCSFGVLKKRILLPSRDYSEEELYYILLHEYIHFQNHDLILKMMIYIFSCVFWWNPIVYLLKRDMGQVLEIKCDLTVISQFEPAKKAKYLETLVAQLKENVVTKSSFSLPKVMTPFLGKQDESSIEERFKYIKLFANKKHTSITPRAILLIITCILFFSSYSLVFQASFEAPAQDIVTGEYTEIAQEYIILWENSDGTYTLDFGDSEHEIDEQMAEDLIAQGTQIKQR